MGSIEARAFVDRVVDGALDTIEMARMVNGGSTFGLDDPERRRIANYIATGTVMHLLSLSAQAGADDDMQAVIRKIAEAWIDEVSR